MLNSASQFQHDFHVQVNAYTEDGDIRLKSLQAVLRNGNDAARIVELYKDQPADLAALVSVAATIDTSKKVVAIVKSNSGAEPVVKMIAGAPEVEQLFRNLLASKYGRSLYDQIAQLLVWASSHPKLSILIGRPKAVLSRTRMEQKPDDEITTLARIEGPAVALSKMREQINTGGIQLARGAATLDAILGELSQEDAFDVLDNQLTSNERVNLLAVRGDLPSTAAFVASWADVLAAMCTDLLSDVPSSKTMDGKRRRAAWSYAQQILAWYKKIEGHRQIKTILSAKLGNGLTLRRMIALSILEDHGGEGEPKTLIDDVEVSEFVEYGLDPDAARMYLRAQVEDQRALTGTRSARRNVEFSNMPRVTTSDIESALVALRPFLQEGGPTQDVSTSTESLDI